MKNEMTFEEALKALETTVERLETGELPLEQALQEFEKGIMMSRLCTKKLEEAEQKVEVLLQVEDGQAQTALFDMDTLDK